MFTYNRKVPYHETDKMGVTHHSNYIKWLEEARAAYLEDVGFPYQAMEKIGIVSPVTALAIEYKSPTTFGDDVVIEVTMRRYTGVRLEVSYEIKNATAGTLAATASSQHCFLKGEKIVSLKKENSAMHSALMAHLSMDSGHTKADEENRG